MWFRFAGHRVDSHIWYPDSIGITGLHWRLTICVYMYHRLRHWFTPANLVLSNQGPISSNTEYLFHWYDLDGLPLTCHALLPRDSRLENQRVISRQVSIKGWITSNQVLHVTVCIQTVLSFHFSPRSLTFGAHFNGFANCSKITLFDLMTSTFELWPCPSRIEPDLIQKQFREIWISEIWIIECEGAIALNGPQHFRTCIALAWLVIPPTPLSLTVALFSPGCFTTTKGFRILAPAFLPLWTVPSAPKNMSSLYQTT